MDSGCIEFTDGTQLSLNCIAVENVEEQSFSLFQDVMPDIGKGGILALVPQLDQHGFQQIRGLLIQDRVGLGTLKKFPRIRIFKRFAPVDPAGGVPVAEHLCHIFDRHLHPHDAGGAVGLLPVVRPVFQMVSVAALVVEPGGGVSLILPLRIVGAAVTLKVSHAHPKFLRRVFGKVVRQTLPIQTQSEAVFANQGTMAANGR